MREQKRSCELHSFVHAEKCNWTDLEKKKKKRTTNFETALLKG